MPPDNSKKCSANSTTTILGGKLPEPIISLKKTPSAYGHITCSKVWQAGNESKYEINISSATLDRPIEETASTLLHEMVHEYCLENNIKDASNNGVYHNRRFKEQAETHGLVVSHHEKYGWTVTSPSEELLDFIIFQGWQDIQMGERLAWADMFGTGNGSKTPGSSEAGASKPPKAKSSTRRWVCPKCGTIIRSTKEVRVICADGMELLRKDAGLSQQQLADDLNLSRRAISLWETGRRTPDLQSALLLADYFHTTLDHLVKGEHS